MFLTMLKICFFINRDEYNLNKEWIDALKNNIDINDDLDAGRYKRDIDLTFLIIQKHTSIHGNSAVLNNF